MVALERRAFARGGRWSKGASSTPTPPVFRSYRAPSQNAQGVRDPQPNLLSGGEKVYLPPRGQHSTEDSRRPPESTPLLPTARTIYSGEGKFAPTADRFRFPDWNCGGAKGGTSLHGKNAENDTAENSSIQGCRAALDRGRIPARIVSVGQGGREVLLRGARSQRESGRRTSRGPRTAKGKNQRAG
jgi:hypothetical protein